MANDPGTDLDQFLLQRGRQPVPVLARADVRSGSRANVGNHVCDVGSTPRNGHSAAGRACPKCADCVAKVRNTPTDRNLIEWCFSREDFRQICFGLKPDRGTRNAASLPRLNGILASCTLASDSLSPTCHALPSGLPPSTISEAGRSSTSRKARTPSNGCGWVITQRSASLGD